MGNKSNNAIVGTGAVLGGAALALKAGGLALAINPVGLAVLAGGVVVLAGIKAFQKLDVSAKHGETEFRMQGNK